MYYVLMGKTVWTAHRTLAAANRMAYGLSTAWVCKGYQFHIRKLAHSWAPGDTPAPRYYRGAAIPVTVPV